MESGGNVWYRRCNFKALELLLYLTIFIVSSYIIKLRDLICCIDSTGVIGW
jgi:hypothetical protein